MPTKKRDSKDEQDTVCKAMYGDGKPVHCECGRWSGEPCAWEGPITETMVVDFMPRNLRDSHRAAGNSGRYPENGAERIRVSEDCAARMIGVDHEWVEVVSPGTEE